MKSEYKKLIKQIIFNNLLFLLFLLFIYFIIELFFNEKNLGDSFNLVLITIISTLIIYLYIIFRLKRNQDDKNNFLYYFFSFSFLFLLGLIFYTLIGSLIYILLIIIIGLVSVSLSYLTNRKWK